MHGADMGSTEDIISGSSLFGRLDGPGRRRMTSIAQRVQLSAGELLCEEGAPADAFFIIMDGDVSIRSTDLSGEETSLGQLGSGAVVGEIGVFTGSPRTASVRALGDVWVMKFARDDVMEILSGYPEILADLRRLGLQRSEDTLTRLLSDDLPE